MGWSKRSVRDRLRKIGATAKEDPQSGDVRVLVAGRPTVFSGTSWRHLGEQLPAIRRSMPGED